MLDKEKCDIKKVNIEKATNKTNIAIILIVISIFTYILPIIYEKFDFGIIFECASLVFLLISRFYMSKYDESKAKRYVICSILSIGWILVYDVLLVITSISKYISFEGSFYLLGEVISITYLYILFSINKYLSKAENPDKHKESTDWFYEKNNN